MEMSRISTYSTHGRHKTKDPRSATCCVQGIPVECRIVNKCEHIFDSGNMYYVHRFYTKCTLMLWLTNTHYTNT